MKKNISNKGVIIGIDALSSMGENYLVVAKGKYNHHLELDMEYIADDPSLVFTWKCTKNGETIVLIDTGICCVNSIEDLKEKVLQPDIIGEEVFLEHERALSEIITIMEEVYKFET